MSLVRTRHRASLGSKLQPGFSAKLQPGFLAKLFFRFMDALAAMGAESIACPSRPTLTSLRPDGATGCRRIKGLGLWA
jgi:hypothetical protein